MRIEQGKPRLSATDLANHLGCRHLTLLDLQAVEGKLSPPTFLSRPPCATAVSIADPSSPSIPRRGAYAPGWVT